MTYPLRSARIVALLLITTLLAACGFHLRGALNNNSDIHQLAVSGHDRDFIRYFSRALERSGVNVTDLAPWRVNILGIERDVQQQGVAVGGLVEQRLAISVVYQLQTASDLPLFSEVALTRERFVTQDEDTPNAAESEQSIIFSELREELIAAMLRQLFSFSQATLTSEADRVAALRLAKEQMEKDAAQQNQPEL